MGNSSMERQESVPRLLAAVIDVLPLSEELTRYLAKLIFGPDVLLQPSNAAGHCSPTWRASIWISPTMNPHP